MPPTLPLVSETPPAADRLSPWAGEALRLLMHELGTQLAVEALPPPASPAPGFDAPAA